jgi:hypothetical protein
MASEPIKPQQKVFPTEEAFEESKVDDVGQQNLRFEDSFVSDVTDDDDATIVAAEAAALKAQASRMESPDKKKSRGFLKKFMGIRGGNKETSSGKNDGSPSPWVPRQVNGKVSRASPSSNNSKSRNKAEKKTKRPKKIKTSQLIKIGAPRDLKPGMSYQSTPNSAEIVVRKHIVEAVSSDDEQDEYERTRTTSTDPSTDDPLVKKEGRPINLTVSTSMDASIDDEGHDSTSMDDEGHDLDKIESFSPPRFDNIENISSSYSTSPTIHNIPLPSDKDHRFKKCDEPFTHEEMSAITDPSFGASPNHVNAVQQENKQVTPKDPDATGQNSDPLGHYWGHGLAPQQEYSVDPFAKPFFQDQASDVTSPVHNLSHLDVESLQEGRSNHTVPDDEIEANSSHDTEESKSKIVPDDEIEANSSHDTEERKSKNVKGRTPTRKVLLEERRQMVMQVQKLIEEARRSHDKNKDETDVKDPVSAATRNQIADKRVELIERRKMLEEKAKSEAAAAKEGANTQTMQSKLTGKAVAYLRQQNESIARNHQSARNVSPSTSYDLHALPEDAVASGTSGSASLDRLSERVAYSTLPSNARPVRNRQEQRDHTTNNASDSTSSLLLKLQGRMVQTITSPSRATEPRQESTPETRASLSTQRIANSNSSKPSRRHRSQTVIAPQRVDQKSIALGIALKRRNREFQISEGRDMRVIPRPKKIAARRHYEPSTLDLDEREIKDPIKRAGLRLLAKAAVPIQCEIRRYLAQQTAVDRLWAIIELQSYFRRWEAEAFLLAHIDSATRIQAAFRGWRDRDNVETQHYCATQIQKVARTFLVSIKAYGKLYLIIMVQAAARSLIARKRYQRISGKVILIQKCFRGFHDRLQVATYHVAATIIQSAGRAYLARLQYQFNLVDILIAQSVARRWLAIQGMRRMVQLEAEMISKDAAWRGYQATMNFIFALADIIIVQRTVRQWLAMKELKLLKKGMRATKIQAFWRGYKAREMMLYDLVDIIIVQVSGVERLGTVAL